jgi:26S proteasome non-ATPase regulatory subunit 9
MGLMPPVSNSPTSEKGSLEDLMSEAKDLIARKDKVEEELRELEDLLITAGVGMDEPLVDNAGFPRSEIDVHSIRTSRNLIHRLRNDHKAVMSDIEKLLHKIHEEKRRQPQQEEQAPIPSTSTAETINFNEMPSAFAVVNAVAPDSPAYTAGLRRHDHILKFGSINASNHQRLQALNALISQSENQQISITLLRDAQTMEIVVTPKSGWGGRGTLGCHLLPL